MRFKLFILLALMADNLPAQTANPQIISSAILKSDTARGMSILSSRKTTDTLLSFRNGWRLTIPQDSVLFRDFRGTNRTSVDTFATFHNGYLYQTAKGAITLPWEQVTNKPALFSGSYTDLTNKPTIPTARQDSTIYYNGSGRIYQRIKKWVGRVSITNANGQVIDVSSAGFGTITSISAIAEKNAGSAPNVSVKTYTNTSVTLNVKEENSAVVRILNIDVLSGSPLIFATGTVWVWLTVEGY